MRYVCRTWENREKNILKVLLLLKLILMIVFFFYLIIICFNVHYQEKTNINLIIYTDNNYYKRPVCPRMKVLSSLTHPCCYKHVFSGAQNKIVSVLFCQYFESQMDLMLFWTPLDFHCKDKNSYNALKSSYVFRRRWNYMN